MTVALITEADANCMETVADVMVRHPNGVTGFSAQNERLQKPSALFLGYAWARSGRRRASAEIASDAI